MGAVVTETSLPGSRYTLGEDGSDELADSAFEWALAPRA